MKENRLKALNGKKIRRQYFNIPILALLTLMLFIPYAILVASIGLDKFDSAEWLSSLWISLCVCFGFSLPWLILRTLNKYLFGRILCVFTEEGLHYPKGMLRWETIEKIEYAIDSKKRWKSDPGKMFRAIVYTKGGKHVVVLNAPLCMLSSAKKYKEGLNVQVSGVTSLLPAILVMAAVLAICPIYVMLLVNAPGPIAPQFVSMLIIMLILYAIKHSIFDFYSIEYRFWSKILPKKWLFYTFFWFDIVTRISSVLIISYFPDWWVIALVSIYIGAVPGTIYSRGRGWDIHSYDNLCRIYITNADYWEKHLGKDRGIKCEETNKEC